MNTDTTIRGLSIRDLADEVTLNATQQINRLIQTHMLQREKENLRIAQAELYRRTQTVIM